MRLIKIREENSNTNIYQETDTLSGNNDQEKN